MALKRRIKKLKNYQIVKMTGRQMLICKQCGHEEVEVPTDVTGVICSYCVQKMVAPPASTVKEKSNKPRGWHLKVFFEHEGVVYSKGEIVTDEEKIAELRNGSTAQSSTKTVSKAKKKRGVKRARTAK